MITIGIDPGLSGAIAYISDAHYEVHDLPVMRDGSLSWIDGAALQSLLLQSFPEKQVRCVIERVHAMPKQGVSSSFNFGVNYGSVLSIVQARGISLEFVTPTQWKRDLGLPKDKKAALFKARLLFPDAELHLAKHDGRAEALLIAHWYRTRVERKAA
jgi:hypothetical protein